MKPTLCTVVDMDRGGLTYLFRLWHTQWNHWDQEACWKRIRVIMVCLYDAISVPRVTRRIGLRAVRLAQNWDPDLWNRWAHGCFQVAKSDIDIVRSLVWIAGDVWRLEERDVVIY